MNVILALDQGTTSSRAMLFDRQGAIVASVQREFPQIYPQPGWVEHDPEVLWETTREVARQALTKAGLTAGDVAGIGITNQRETVVVWDRRTGVPLCNAIVWQDRRTAGFCDELKGRDGGAVAERVRRVTGLVVDAYFSASKLHWVLENVPGARVRAERGELAFGTVDSWLLWQLTGGVRGGLHATDVSNASRTMLMDLAQGAWAAEMMELFGIPAAMLPAICPSSGVIGHTDPALFGGSIPIAGVAGDQQAALFGQACFTPGLAKNTYGTGCFMLMNTGTTPPVSRHRLLSTVAWGVPGVLGKVSEYRSIGVSASPTSTLRHSDTPTPLIYALEGSVFIGGAVVQWLRDGLGLVKSAGEIEALAASVPDSGDVYLVPAFAGLGAPHWDQYARGTITGLTRGTTAGHIARAALEGIAFQVADVLEVMEQDSGVKIAELRADGGAARNNLLLQFQADLLGVPVVRPLVTETTALGAAYLAGLSVGFWRDQQELAAKWAVERRFVPAMRAEEVQRRRARWGEALARARDWERARE
jgi:glycerol kinase